METVQVILEDETKVTRPEVLREAVEVLSKLREFGDHVLIFETDTEITRIEVRTSTKKSFWKRLFSKTKTDR